MLGNQTKNHQVVMELNYGILCCIHDNAEIALDC